MSNYNYAELLCDNQYAIGSASDILIAGHRLLLLITIWVLVISTILCLTKFWGLSEFALQLHCISFILYSFFFFFLNDMNVQ